MERWRLRRIHRKKDLEIIYKEKASSFRGSFLHLEKEGFREGGAFPSKENASALSGGIQIG